MLSRSFKIFSLAGFDIRVDLSWFLVVVLVAWSLAASLFPQQYPDLSTESYWYMGVAGAVLLFVSIVLHELGHAITARRFGIEMGGITLFIFGGVAEMRDEPPSPGAEFWVAVGGPIVSVIIAGMCLGAELLGRQMGWPTPVLGVLWYLWVINAVLVAFNSVPAFPLDGGRVLRSILWKVKGSLRWATRITSEIGGGFGLFLIVMGVVAFISGNIVGGIWWFILGMFLRGAVRMSYRQMLMRSHLQGEPIRKFMQTDVHAVPPSTSVEDLVENYVYRYHHKMFPVSDNGDLVGCVTTERIKDLSRDEWQQRSAGDIAEPCGQSNTITEDTDALKALSRMNREGVSRLVVVDKNGRLTGILTLKDLMAFLSMKIDFDEQEEDQ